MGRYDRPADIADIFHSLARRVERLEGASVTTVYVRPTLPDLAGDGAVVVVGTRLYVRVAGAWRYTELSAL